MANAQVRVSSSFGSSPPPPLSGPPDSDPIALQSLLPQAEPAEPILSLVSVSPQATTPIKAVVSSPAVTEVASSPPLATAQPSITPTNALPSVNLNSPSSAVPPYNGWSQAPVVLGIALGVAVLIALVLLGCFGLRRRRQRKRRDIDIPSSSETETLTSRRSADVPSKEEKRFDIENPPPVYLGKDQGRPIFPHLKTLHLLSRTTSNASTLTSNSTLVNGLNRNRRLYSTQPQIPSVSVTHDHSRTSLPDGFESYAYALRSPQFVDGKPSKRLSLVSSISTIRFARDSHGWALRRVSDGSLDRATVFDDEQTKEHSPPLVGTSTTPPSEPCTVSRGARKNPPSLPRLDIPAVSSYKRYEDNLGDIQYQPTPLAPPPAKIRARSVTPTHPVVRRNAGVESADPLIDGSISSVRPQGRSPPNECRKLAPSTRPGNTIMHSAIAKGKISREEAESVLGVRLAITP